MPDLFARELIDVGFGARTAQLLKRTQAIPKAAASLNAERPSALLNFQTLAVQRDLDSPESLVLVDDVVTAGATLLGCANRLHDVYPGVAIKAVAAARTISDGSRFRMAIEPAFGTITLRATGKTIRDP